MVARFVDGQCTCCRQLTPPYPGINVHRALAWAQSYDGKRCHDCWGLVGGMLGGLMINWILDWKQR